MSRTNTIIALLGSLMVIALLAVLCSRQTRDFRIGEQRQAKIILDGIRQQEGVWFNASHNYYYPPVGDYASATQIGALDPIHVSIPIDCSYRFTIVVTPDSGFKATATLDNPGLDNDPDPDIWSIDQTGKITAISDDLKYVPKKP